MTRGLRKQQFAYMQCLATFYHSCKASPRAFHLFSGMNLVMIRLLNKAYLTAKKKHAYNFVATTLGYISILSEKIGILSVS